MGESFIGVTQSLDAQQLLSELKPWVRSALLSTLRERLVRRA